MLLILHVLVALSSVLQASYLYIRPSSRGFKLSYGLVGATIGSGTILVIASHSPLLGSCLAGLTYLGIVSAAIMAAHYKYAHQTDD